MIVGYLLVYLGALGAVAVLGPDHAWRDDLMLGAGVGVVVALVVWWTRKWSPPSLDAATPKAELVVCFAWLALVSGIDWLTRSAGVEAINAFTNWFFLVLVPLGLMGVARRGRLGLPLRSLGLIREGLGRGLVLALAMAVLTTPLLYVVGVRQRVMIDRIIDEPRRGLLSLGVGLVVALLTVGIVEEVFFRGILLSRLELVASRPSHAVAISSIAFGLFHLPMFYLSGYEPTMGNLGWAAAAIITQPAVTSILLGVLWFRTHSLPSVIALHAYVDAFAITGSGNIGTG